MIKENAAIFSEVFHHLFNAKVNEGTFHQLLNRTFKKTQRTL